MKPLKESKIEERKNLTFKIASDAIRELNVPEFNLERSEFTQNKSGVFYTEREMDIDLCIEFRLTFTTGYLQTSLIGFVFNIIDELELLYESPKAKEILELDDNDKNEVIYQKALDLTKQYIAHLPNVIFHSFHQTAKETIVNYLKKMVEHDLRESRKIQGLPDNFSLTPNNNLEEIVKLYPEGQFGFCERLEMIDKEYTTYRKTAYKDRKVWLKNQNPENLPKEYEALRLLFNQAKKEYKIQFDAYNVINSNISNWESYWEKVFNEKFPSLMLTEDFQFEDASYLAYQQLSDKYDHNAEYLKRLVRNSKKKAKIYSSTCE